MVEKYGSYETSKLSSYLISLKNMHQNFGLKLPILGWTCSNPNCDSANHSQCFFQTISVPRNSEQNVRILRVSIIIYHFCSRQNIKSLALKAFAMIGIKYGKCCVFQKQRTEKHLHQSIWDYLHDEEYKVLLILGLEKDEKSTLLFSIYLCHLATPWRKQLEVLNIMNKFKITYFNFHAHTWRGNYFA